MKQYKFKNINFFLKTNNMYIPYKVFSKKKSLIKYQIFIYFTLYIAYSNSNQLQISIIIL